MKDYKSDQGINYPMVSGPSNQGGGVDVDKDYNPAALPTIVLLAPNKDVKEKDIWPANTILSTLEKYQFTSIVIEDLSESHQYTIYSGSHININSVNSGIISITVSENNTYSASVYSLDGALLKTIVNNFFTKGTHSISWSNKKLARGQYILNLNSQKGEKAKRFIVK